MFAGKGVDNSTKGQEKRKRKICHDTSSSPNSFPDTQPTTHKHKREKKCSADSVPETKTNGGILLQRIQSPFIASWAFFVTRPQKKAHTRAGAYVFLSVSSVQSSFHAVSVLQIISCSDSLFPLSPPQQRQWEGHNHGRSPTSQPLGDKKRPPLVPFGSFLEGSG